MCKIESKSYNELKEKIKMTKNEPILDRTIECPVCRTKTMRLSHRPVVGKEYFDDRCHTYFGVDELVNKFGYDLGDFYDGIRTEIPLEKFLELYEKEQLENKQANCPHLHIVNFPPFVPNIFVQYTECIECKKKFTQSVQVEDKIVATTWFDGDTVSVIDEPVFHSLAERDEAYQMVQRMFDDIPEWENNKVDYGYPI